METKYIIIDMNKQKALYGVKGLTLQFSSESVAEEVAKQFFHACTYLIIPITITAPTGKEEKP